MGLDIRKPIGGLLAILGAILVVYGLTGDPAQYRKSNGRNINVAWGSVLVVAGGAFLWGSRRGAARQNSQ
jgi:hypothetical protein